MARHKFIKPSNKPKNSKDPNFFPEEIITEILTRVPVKSLLRFRCVSKSWISLISSPRLIQSHLTISSNSPRIMSIFQTPARFNHFSATSLKAVGIDFPLKIPENGCVMVAGSCNGLVCISIDFNELFIWNPCTRICTKLPNVNVEMRHRVYGFGYKESDDDYKVVGISFPFMRNLGSDIFIYSLRTNSWKRVGEFKAGLPGPDKGCFFLGKIHFRVICYSESGEFAKHDDIVSFNLENEVYEVIRGPSYREGDVLGLSLEVLKGSLCILHSTENCADLWVMEEYGVQKSWSKTISIPYFMLENRKSYWYSAPLVMLPSGEILLVSDHYQFVVYNPKDKTMWVPESRNLNRSMVACVYVESLVSPVMNERIGRHDR